MRTLKIRLFQHLTVSLLALIATDATQLQGQNVYDTYNPYGSSWPSSTYSWGNTHQGYEGEYQLFYDGLNWSQFVLNSNYGIAYKIEPVSFPFLADCSTGDCGNLNSTTRNLRVANPFDPELYTFFALFDQGINTDNEFMSNPGRLSSAEFTRNAAIGDTRNFYPHTVLRHTYYLLASQTLDACVLDSFTFILDHTRGRMSEYPFRSNNYQSAESEHDIAIKPWVIYPTTPFLSTPAQTSNQFGTIDYFLYPDAHYFPGICAATWNLIPDPSVPGGQGLDATDYAHPSPFSLRGVMLGNAGEEPFAGYDMNALPVPGIPHNYFINYNIDLRLINPSERIIYNPSHVSITTPASAPLVFPSGYTFQTVGATYPTAQEVASADPSNMYGDLRKVPIHGSALHLTDNPDTFIDERQSIYRVTPNSKLVIEPCVNIWDAKIIVEANAILEYDPTQLYGNVVFEIDPAATVISYSTNQTTACLYNCFLPEHYNAGQIAITSNTTWSNSNISTLFPGISPWSAAESNTIRIANGLTISTGATLTLDQNVNLEFGPLAKVIIEPGARLIVNGTSTNPCHIRAACQKEWKGIEVWGDRTQGQGLLSNTPQGVLILNNCSIEHALEAVTVGDPSALGREGGIVKATNCEFLNNVRDVQYLSYRNFGPNNSNLNNLGSFSSCQFRTTEYFYDPSLNLDNGFSPTSGIAHVTLWDVKYVLFRNCVFSNDIPTNYKPHLRGVGIFGIDAGLNLIAAAPCEFEGLSDGIWMQSSGFSNATISIAGADFVNNIHGVVMEGTFFTQVMHNTFDVPESPQFGYSTDALEKGYDKPVGVFMVGATDFLITENSFNVGDNSALITPQGDCSDCSYNIVVSESAVDNPLSPEPYGAARIYKNTINHASMGVQVQGNNGYAITAEGLDVMCNSFDDLVNYDLGVIGNFQLTSSMRDLGSCIQNNMQAGNSFLDCGNSNSNDNLYVDAYSMNYWYSDNPTEIPSNSCANTWLLACPATGSHGCPSISNAQATLAQITNRYDQAVTEYGEESRLLDSLIDGGNTEDVLDQIERTSGSTLYDTLISLSPWLSDTVLKKLVNPSYRSTLSEEQLVEILVLNGGLNDDVFASVLNTAPELSDYHKELLVENQSQLGERQQKEILRNALEFNLMTESAAIASYATVHDSLDAGIAAIGEAQNLTVLQSVFQMQFSSGLIESADSTLDIILSTQNNVESAWTLLASTSLTQYSQGRNWLLADSSEVALVDSLISVTPSLVNLSVIRDYHINRRSTILNPYPLDPARRFDHTELTMSTDSAGGSALLLITPNPTSGAFTVQLPGAKSLNSAQLQVVSPLGLVIYETGELEEQSVTLESNGWAPGVYYIRIVRDMEILSVEKLVIVK